MCVVNNATYYRKLSLLLILTIFSVIAIFILNNKVTNSGKWLANNTNSATAPTSQTQDRSYNNISIATSTEKTNSYHLITEVPRESFTAAVSAREYLQLHRDKFIHLVTERQSKSTTSTDEPTYTFTATLEAHQTKRYISLVYTINEYTGGAHANTQIRTFVQAKASNVLVDLEQVIEQSKSEFMTNTRTKLRKKFGTSLTNRQLFPNAVANLQFKDINNFYITDEHIVVLFSPCTIALGAAGVISVSLDRRL